MRSFSMVLLSNNSVGVCVIDKLVGVWKGD